MPLVVSGRRVRWVRETAEVRQLRREAWGSLEWLQWETAMAALESPALLISEIQRNSAASLSSREVKQCITFCRVTSVNSCVTLLTRSQWQRGASITTVLKVLLPLLEHVPGIKGPLRNQSLGLLGTLEADRDFRSATNTQKVREVQKVKRELFLSSWRSAGWNCTKSGDEHQVQGMFFNLIHWQILGQGKLNDQLAYIRFYNQNVQRIQKVQETPLKISSSDQIEFLYSLFLASAVSEAHWFTASLQKEWFLNCLIYLWSTQCQTWQPDWPHAGIVFEEAPSK